MQIEFEKLAEPLQKTQMVLDNFHSNWNLIESVPAALDSCCEQPQAAWSQRHLRELSRQHPKMVAQAVLDRNDYENDTGKELNLAYRKFLARHLSPVSKAEFDTLLGKP